MDIHQVAELVSMSLTPATIWLSLMVSVLWGVSVKQLLLRNRKFKPTDWFAIGVAAGFFGAALDNSYWGVAWTCNFFDVPEAGWWFQNGVYPNIFSRQLLGIFAAYCHLRSYCEFEADRSGRMRLLIPMSLILCAVSAVSLLVAAMVLK